MATVQDQSTSSPRRSKRQQTLSSRLRGYYEEGDDSDLEPAYDAAELAASEQHNAALVKHIASQEFTLDYIREGGLTEPLHMRERQHLNMRLPGPEFTVTDVMKLVGPDRIVDVMDCANQEAMQMTMKEWRDYYVSKKRRNEVLNVISLEFSHSALDPFVQAPETVRQIDWIDQVWPSDIKALQQDATNAVSTMMYPKVQKYCLMSVAGCYTDFHVDFGGSSVWYHVFRGQKVFWLIRPTARNLTRFEHWSKGDQAQFFGELCPGECCKVNLKAGDTFIIPSGWIHAVYTPEDSLVFGGNFVHTFSIPTHLEIDALERRLKVQARYKFPMYHTLHWYALLHYKALLSHEDTACEVSQLERAALQRLIPWLRRQARLSPDDIPAAAGESPGTILQRMSSLLGTTGAMNTGNLDAGHRGASPPQAKAEAEESTLHEQQSVQQDKACEPQQHQAPPSTASLEDLEVEQAEREEGEAELSPAPIEINMRLVKKLLLLPETNKDIVASLSKTTVDDGDLSAAVDALMHRPSDEAALHSNGDADPSEAVEASKLAVCQAAMQFWDALEEPRRRHLRQRFRQDALRRRAERAASAQTVNNAGANANSRVAPSGAERRKPGQGSSQSQPLNGLRSRNSAVRSTSRATTAKSARTTAMLGIPIRVNGSKRLQLFMGGEQGPAIVASQNRLAENGRVPVETAPESNNSANTSSGSNQQADAGVVERNDGVVSLASRISSSSEAVQGRSSVAAQQAQKRQSPTAPQHHTSHDTTPLSRGSDQRSFHASNDSSEPSRSRANHVQDRKRRKKHDARPSPDRAPDSRDAISASSIPLSASLRSDRHSPVPHNQRHKGRAPAHERRSNSRDSSHKGSTSAKTKQHDQVQDALAKATQGNSEMLQRIQAMLQRHPKPLAASEDSPSSSTFSGSATKGSDKKSQALAGGTANSISGSDPGATETAATQQVPSPSGTAKGSQKTVSSKPQSLLDSSTHPAMLLAQQILQGSKSSRPHGSSNASHPSTSQEALNRSGRSNKKSHVPLITTSTSAGSRPTAVYRYTSDGRAVLVAGEPVMPVDAENGGMSRASDSSRGNADRYSSKHERERSPPRRHEQHSGSGGYYAGRRSENDYIDYEYHRYREHERYGRRDSDRWHEPPSYQYGRDQQEYDYRRAGIEAAAEGPYLQEHHRRVNPPENATAPQAATSGSYSDGSSSRHALEAGAIDTQALLRDLADIQDILGVVRSDAESQPNHQQSGSTIAGAAHQSAAQHPTALARHDQTYATHAYDSNAHAYSQPGHYNHDAHQASFQHPQQSYSGSLGQFYQATHYADPTDPRHDNNAYSQSAAVTVPSATYATATSHPLPQYHYSYAPSASWAGHHQSGASTVQQSNVGSWSSYHEQQQ